MTRHAGVANLRETAQKALALPGVQNADVLVDDARAEKPVLELFVGPQFGRVPPRVLRCLADNDVGIYSVTPCNDHHVILAV